MIFYKYGKSLKYLKLQITMSNEHKKIRIFFLFFLFCYT